MSLDRVGRGTARLPPEITLDDLAEMNEMDEIGYRFELSPEGVLSATPLQSVDHQITVSRLLA
jgi:hypothetical protein